MDVRRLEQAINKLPWYKQIAAMSFLLLMIMIYFAIEFWHWVLSKFK